MTNLKDNIREIFCKIFKIDKPFLIKKKVISHFKNYKYSKGEFKFDWKGVILYLRNNSSDFEVFNQVFIDKEYQFANVLFKNSFKRNPKTLIDLGANIGLTSVYFKQLYPDIEILALEPEDYNFELLKKNTYSLTKVTTLKKGVWNEKTELKISSDFRDKRSWAFRLDKENGNQIIQTIQLIDLIDRFQKKNIDILKIDIEGAEKEVLLQDKDIQRALQKVNLICVEIHDEVVSRLEITNVLKDSGFSIYAKNETLFGVK